MPWEVTSNGIKWKFKRCLCCHVGDCLAPCSFYPPQPTATRTFSPGHTCCIYDHGVDFSGLSASSLPLFPVAILEGVPPSSSVPVQGRSDAAAGAGPAQHQRPSYCVFLSSESTERVFNDVEKDSVCVHVTAGSRCALEQDPTGTVDGGDQLA